jgi:proteic killer suppression protein
VRIVLSKKAGKQLTLVPHYIYRKYLYWVNLLEVIGLLDSRKYKGFHDEPLIGRRYGQRSVRLSKYYRLIYREVMSGYYDVIEILEVNKHDY